MLKDRGLIGHNTSRSLLTVGSKGPETGFAEINRVNRDSATTVLPSRHNGADQVSVSASAIMRLFTTRRRS